MTCLLLGYISFSLLSVLLAGCGTSSAPPTGFVTTDAHSFASLTWHVADGQLRGQWSMSHYDAPLTAFSRPHTAHGSYTGTLTGTRVTITLPGETLTGTFDGSDLTLETNQGQPPQRWVSVSEQEMHALSTAFEAYEHLRGALSTLRADSAPVPADSDPLWQDQRVHIAEEYVAVLQGKMTAMQQTVSEQERCYQADQFAQYVQTDASTFTLTKPMQTTVGKDVNRVQQEWKQVQALSVPQRADLPLPWLLTQKDVTAALAPGQQVLFAFQQATQRDQRRMDALKQQYTAISTQAATIKKSCS